MDRGATLTPMIVVQRQLCLTLDEFESFLARHGRDLAPDREGAIETGARRRDAIARVTEMCHELQALQLSFRRALAAFEDGATQTQIDGGARGHVSGVATSWDRAFGHAFSDVVEALVGLRGEPVDSDRPAELPTAAAAHNWNDSCAIECDEQPGERSSQVCGFPAPFQGEPLTRRFLFGLSSAAIAPGAVANDGTLVVSSVGPSYMMYVGLACFVILLVGAGCCGGWWLRTRWTSKDWDAKTTDEKVDAASSASPLRSAPSSERVAVREGGPEVLTSCRRRPGAPAEPADAGREETDELSQLLREQTLEALREIARGRSIPVGGLKGDLVRRLATGGARPPSRAQASEVHRTRQIMNRSGLSYAVEPSDLLSEETVRQWLARARDLLRVAEQVRQPDHRSGCSG